MSGVVLFPSPSSQGSCLPSDIIFHPWKKEENGNQSRVILYTITLTNPLAPKTATVRETQVRGGGKNPARVFLKDEDWAGERPLELGLV